MTRGGLYPTVPCSDGGNPNRQRSLQEIEEMRVEVVAGIGHAP
jgi:hypothetical protein